MPERERCFSHQMVSPEWNARVVLPCDRAGTPAERQSGWGVAWCQCPLWHLLACSGGKFKFSASRPNLWPPDRVSSTVGMKFETPGPVVVHNGGHSRLNWATTPLHPGRLQLFPCQTCLPLCLEFLRGCQSVHLTSFPQSQKRWQGQSKWQGNPQVGKCLERC